MNSKNSSDELRDAVLYALHQVAPEADLKNLNPDVSLRQELEIDSMDFLRFMVKLHEKLNVDIPEKDYPQLDTLNNCIKYLAKI